VHIGHGSWQSETSPENEGEKTTYRKKWSVPFRTQRVETEGKSEDIEINPKADSHPSTNQA
jgi:hypothetical protein